MCVHILISGTHQLLWEDVRDNDGHDFISDAIGSILIEVNDEEGFIHKELVIQKRGHECIQPIRTIRNSCVVSIIKLVGGDHYVLGESIVGKILSERMEIFDDVQALLLLDIVVE